MTKYLKLKEKELIEICIADTFLKRFMGYMLRKVPHFEAILFYPCSSIHTFFMKFAIDVIFVDKNMIVIKKIEALKKGKIIMPISQAKMVIEGKEGVFKNIQTGDKLEFFNDQDVFHKEETDQYIVKVIDV